MEFQDLFTSIAVVLVGIIAMLSLTNFYNTSYGTTAGSTFNNTMNNVNILGNITAIGVQTSNSTITDSGSGSTGSGVTDLVKKSLATLTLLPTMLGLIPDMMVDAATILNIPTAYVLIAKYVFIFAFALLFAYLLLLGAKRL